MSPSSDKPTKLIKKYANRRLYDTEKSRYITLADLTVLAREHVHFVVEDARTGKDITRQILVQIISDHEMVEEKSMMTTEALREVVSLYIPSPINQMFVDYLGNALTNFMRQQSSLQQQMDGLFSDFASPPETDEARDQQTGMWKSLMEIFAPAHLSTEQIGELMQLGQRDQAALTTDPAQLPTTKQNDRPTPDAEELKELQDQLASMQQRLNQLTGD